MKIKRNIPVKTRRRVEGIGTLARRSYYLMGRKGLHGASLLIGVAIRLHRANRRRKHFAAKHNLVIPTATKPKTWACSLRSLREVNRLYVATFWILLRSRNSCDFTDGRRGDGAYQSALEAMAMLKEAGADNALHSNRISL